MERLPVNPLAIKARLEQDRSLDSFGADEPYRPCKVSVFVDDELGDCPPWWRRVGEVNLVLVDLRQEHDLLARWQLGNVVELLADVVADRPQARLVDELETTLLPGPPAAIVVREIEIGAPWQQHCDMTIPLLATALDTARPLGRFAVVDTDPHSELRRRRFEDPADRERLSAVLAALLENAGFGTYRGFHLASLHDPAWQAHNAKLVIGWLTDLMTRH
ncbi:hypothetical protein SAMN05421835_108198 [Amycolatopsis sacchari]|uniref:Uncharacterized protein n=1 Tax=Amycolatopsis sacchari TaxID=115433 RepID=A0A1I3U2D1_9PSEU|nr:hypothetical protein [Amycolatopsis sacchari]SFJ76903.1 hypothetical protein SAMN05421835_108198 [Amycolatopsis sacchari]